MTTRMSAALFLVLPGVVAAVLRRAVPISWLELDSQPICVFPARQNFSGKVQVFVHKDNTRHLEFGDAWSGTQTSVTCKGPMPTECLSKFQEDGAPANCDSVVCPCDRDADQVDAAYLAAMVDVVVPLCQAAPKGATFNVLNVGLGGGDVPSYLFSHCPNTTHVESIEYDPRVVSVATKFFGTNTEGGRHVIDVGDGGAKVQELLKAGRKYDAVLVDVFDDAGDVPPTCVGDTFAQNLHALLRPSGKLVQQVWERQHAELLKSFRNSFSVAMVENRGGQDGQWVVIASKNAKDA